jgi:hypothetical protein
MIVQKTQNENGAFVPDIPEGLEYRSAIYREETDDYLVTFSAEQQDANRISPAQGRTQLSRDGKLRNVTNSIMSSASEEVQIFWEFATFWDRNTPTVKALAEQYKIDLDVFWVKAKAIEV